MLIRESFRLVESSRWDHGALPWVSRRGFVSRSFVSRRVLRAPRRQHSVKRNLSAGRTATPAQRRKLSFGRQASACPRDEPPRVSRLVPVQPLTSAASSVAYRSNGRVSVLVIQLVTDSAEDVDDRGGLFGRRFGLGFRLPRLVRAPPEIAGCASLPGGSLAG